MPKLWTSSPTTRCSASLGTARFERGEKPKLIADELPGGDNVYVPVAEFEDSVRLETPAPVEFSLHDLLA